MEEKKPVSFLDDYSKANIQEVLKRKRKRQEDKVKDGNLKKVEKLQEEIKKIEEESVETIKNIEEEKNKKIEKIEEEKNKKIEKIKKEITMIKEGEPKQLDEIRQEIENNEKDLILSLEEDIELKSIILNAKEKVNKNK